MSIVAQPHRWPRTAHLTAESSALLVIDMQGDFCLSGGYLDRMGVDLTRMQAPIPVVQRLAKTARAAGVRVIYTRQGYRPDLAEMSPERRLDTRRGEALVGSRGRLGRCLIRGEEGWQIIPELAPDPNDFVIDKTANSAFYGTDLDPILRSNDIRHLMLCGNTLEVCVHSTLRSAGDRGFDCLVVSDACGCPDVQLHAASIQTILGEDGVLGSVAWAVDVIAYWDEYRPA